MSTRATPDEVEGFGLLVSRGLGFCVSNLPDRSLAEVLARRAATRGVSHRDYLDWLDANPSDAEVAALASELTVSETYFFRDRNQLQAFVEAAVPERLRARAGAPLRILSAGCSSGEEPYTLAILLRDSAPAGLADLEIHGIDVNPGVLERARCGRYSAWALRETSPELRRRWFRASGSEFVLDEDIRRSVTFHEHNLIDGGPWLGPPGGYDVILCRNVLMYLTSAVAEAVVARLTRALAPGGFLFLGYAETLRGLSTDFALCHTHGAFYYQRKDGRHPDGPVPGILVPRSGLGADVDLAGFEAITHATARVLALTAALPAAAEQTPPEASRPDLSVAHGLLSAEQFGAALEAVCELPREYRGDPEVLILRAVLLAAAGRYADAQDVCHQLLDRDLRDAGAHYVLASCRDALGDESGARTHSRRAAHLDSGFAMPRLHLGLLARRAGDQRAARADFAQALTLLPREKPDRLLLFGGGFGRATLLELCRAELLRCGGAP